MTALTNTRWEQFAQHFAANGNAADAARQVGYSSHPAARGHDILQRPDVAARVQELLAARPSLPARLAHRLDAGTLHRAAQAISFLASLA
jgi:phage terminase small subunit